jgi:hypothetical protein
MLIVKFWSDLGVLKEKNYPLLHTKQVKFKENLAPQKWDRFDSWPKLKFYRLGPRFVPASAESDRRFPEADLSPAAIRRRTERGIRRPGARITIFCDFCQFSAIFANFRRKIGVLLENQCLGQ